MEFSYKIDELISILGESNVEGSTNNKITGIASLKNAGSCDISFLGNMKYSKDVSNCKATVLLLPLNFEGQPKDNQVYIRISSPSYALTLICGHIEKHNLKKYSPGIHPTAVVDNSVIIDKTAYIGPLCVIEEGTKIGANTYLDAQIYIGKNVEIGDDCRLSAHVNISSYNKIGNRVHLHAGVVIGSDGYGYEFIDGKHFKSPQIGKVVVEDDVEIGANTTIDRARFSETRIGQGTKIDNLVQIAHNVVIGKNCLIVSQTGISGSSILEDNIIIGGQAGIAGHITIGEGSKIGGQSGVTNNIPSKSYVNGTPACSHYKSQKIISLSRRLPDLFKRVKILEEFSSEAD